MKFFIEASFTRPPKFSAYDFSLSFHFGVLFRYSLNGLGEKLRNNGWLESCDRLLFRQFESVHILGEFWRGNGHLQLTGTVHSHKVALIFYRRVCYSPLGPVYLVFRLDTIIVQKVNRPGCISSQFS